jgi:hypothetical protein
MRTNNVALMGSTSMQATTLFAVVVWFVQSTVFIGSLPIAVENCVGIIGNVIALGIRFRVWLYGLEVVRDSEVELIDSEDGGDGANSSDNDDVRDIRDVRDCGIEGNVQGIKVENDGIV